MNEKNNTKSIQRAIGEIRELRMTGEENARVRANLSRMIEDTQAAGPAAASTLESDGGALSDRESRIKSPFVSLGTWSFVLMALAIVILIGGGTTIAAEKALPGDRLYGFKVGVVEPIAGVFRGTGATLAEWQASLVSERLSEAETLASEGELNDERRQKIEKLLDKHTAAFDIALDDTVKNDSAEKAKGIGNSLRDNIVTHVKQLDNIIVYASSTATTSSAGKPAQDKKDKSAERANINSANDLRQKAEKHVDDLKASWTLPLPSPGPTSMDETLKSNVSVGSTNPTPNVRGQGETNPGNSLKAAAHEAVQIRTDKTAKVK